MAATGSVGYKGATQIINGQNQAGEMVPVAYVEGEMVNARGQKLVTVDFLPDEGDPVAIVLFHHGLSEYAGRYKDVFSRFAALSIAVYSFDAHGMGKSEPHTEAERSYVETFDHLVDDYELRLKTIQDAYAAASKPLPPLFAAGHSLGGLVVLHAVARNMKPYAGVILHSAAIDVEWNLVLRVQAAVGNLLSAMIPKKPIAPAVRSEDMSQDPQVVAEYLADPLIYTGKVKARTANTSLKAFRALGGLIPRLDLPLYVCHGTMDRCTNYKAAHRLYEQWPCKDKVFKPVEGGYHELLHGPEKAQCFEWLVAFIREHLGPRASL